MERQVITVDIAPGNSQVERLGSSQGDIGRPMGVYIVQNGVALDCSAYSAELYILKPDGKFYTTQATVDATEKNLIKWETALQETPVAGACAAQIRIAAGDEDIGTARFVEFVEAAPGDMGAASESEVALLTEYVRQARESATCAGRDATTASGAASSASGSASTASAAASTATQAASAATAAAERAEEVEESIPADYSQLSDDVSGLKSAFEQLDANVITESAGPAPIVSVTDGADGMPMREVKVAIEPVQDLHGYDSPWPAGGGVNQFDESTVTFGKWINAAGAKGSAEFGCISEAIPINGNSGCVFKYYGTQPNSCSVVEYASDDTFITRNHASNGNVSCTFNANTAYIVVQVSAPSSPSIAITPTILASYKMLLCFGSTAPTDYTPYSNICPISGWTGAKVTRTGINIWDEEWEVGGISATTGENVVDARIRSKNYIRVEPGKSYYITTPRTSNDIRLYYYDEDKKFISESGWKYNGVFNITTAKYFRFVIASGYGTTYNHDISVNYPSTYTEYYAYQGQTYEVTFPADPGTVYGGTLDVASGKLVVDRKIIVLNGTETIAVVDDIVTIDGYSEFNSRGRAISSHYKSVAKGWNNLNFGEWQLVSFRLGFKDAHNSDVATAQAYITEQYQNGTPMQFIGELRNKVVIQLTPQEIETLLGTNNVWSDAGDTAITYPADTKTYIDNRINSTRKLIAGIETGFAASKAYAVGDMLIIGDDLYKVASAIASGATITVGTNVTKTTVAEQLIALANA